MAHIIKTLKNGLRVVIDPMPQVETVSLGVWVNVGSRYETNDEHGVSHFLEHMAFKGTKKRTAYQIVEAIENVGGYINAYTSREQTAYYIRVLKEDVALGIDIIADILQNSIFDESEYERERGVILQEIGQSFDTPDDIVFDYFQETAFQNQPIGRPILGTVQGISHMPRERLMDYMKNHYTPSRMIFSVSGNVNPDKMFSMIEDAFELFERDKVLHERQNAQYTGGDYRQEKELEQTHIVMGFPGLCYGDDDYYASALLSTLLGEGMSSRLFQEIREKQGLVYSIYSFNSPFQDNGIFGLYAGTGGDKVRQLLTTAINELKRVKQDVTQDELDRARAQIKARIMMSLESTSSRCQQQAQQLLIFNRIISPDEVIQKLNAIKVGDIQRVSADIFSQKPTLTVLGSLEGVHDFDDLVSNLQG